MENYQRITNICYPRGSIIYAQFNKNSEFYFLNMRPLIVVSNQTQMFDSLSCIACGSRDRPGIEISLFNHLYGKWIGGHQFSVAQPYTMYTVIVSQIVEFHGVIDPFTMKAIDKAIAFHLGLSEEVPPYMEGIYKELLEPRYSIGTEYNTQLEDPHQMGSYNETTRKFERIPPKNKGVIPGKPYPKKTETVPPKTKFELDPNRVMEQFLTNKFTPEGEPEGPKLEIPKEEPKEELKETEVKRVGTATLMVPELKENPLSTISDSILNIAASLTDDDRLLFITRKFVAGNTSKGLQVYANQIPSIRKALEYSYILNPKFINRMKGRICKRQSNFRFLSNFEKVACILYYTPKDLEITESGYADIAKQVIRENHLQFEDGRNWRGLNNYERLKKIYRKH